jgi:hypothetical protein
VALNVTLEPVGGPLSEDPGTTDTLGVLETLPFEPQLPVPNRSM